LDTAEAQHLMDGLDWPGAIKDIRASVNWLKSNGSKKVLNLNKVLSVRIKFLRKMQMNYNCCDRLVPLECAWEVH